VPIKNQRTVAGHVCCSSRLTFLPILYALSRGPITYLTVLGVSNGAIVSYAYYPLDMAESYCPALGDAMESYRQCWVSWAYQSLPKAPVQPEINR
jgi:hypothetical protein